MAFWKEDLLKVNGYNEAITGWGSEDHELVCRLINSGVRKRTIKFAGIVFEQQPQYFERNESQETNLVR